jgi:hypothetical protein
MIRSLFIAGFAVSAVLMNAFSAHADEPAGGVSIVRGAFTDRVENRLPATETPAFAHDAFATYWVEVDNPGDATEVTLVWKLDGKEILRQALDVGHAPRWRTWGACGTQKAKTIEVELLDKEGRSLKTDSATVS